MAVGVTLVSVMGPLGCALGVFVVCSYKMSEMSMKNLYARFLNLSKALQENSYPDLDVDLCALLESVFLHTSQTQSFYTVSDLIARSDLSSPATLHSRLKKLIAMQYLELVSDRQDGRIKYVTLSSRGRQYFEHLDQSLRKSLRP